MDVLLNKPLRLARSLLKRPMVNRLAPTLSVMLLLILPGCLTTRGTVTTGSARATIDARCAGARPITYAVKGTAVEGHGDTPKTILQIRQMNKTYALKKCPAFKGTK